MIELLATFALLQLVVILVLAWLLADFIKERRSRCFQHDQIIIDASQKAEEIMAKAAIKAAVLEKDWKRRLQQQLDEAVRRTTKELLQELEQIKKNDINTFRKVSNSIGSATKKHSDELHRELEKAKEEQLQEINVHIFEILQLVAEEALGEKVNFAGREKMIFAALEKAKRRGVL